MRRGADAISAIVSNMEYDNYLRRLDVASVLDHYGVENARQEKGKKGSVEIVHSCLLDRVETHHSNGDANPSASANVELKKYVCWAFWGGDMFEFIQKMEDKNDFASILPLVRNFLSGSTINNESFLEEIEKAISSSKAIGSSDVFSGYSDRILLPWAWVHPFLSERGIDVDVAKRLQIGWREDLNRITIPVYWQGNLIGWQARAIPDRPGAWPGTWDGQYPKYKSSPGFPKSSVLYSATPHGYLPSSSTVVVVESPFSVIKAESLKLSVPVVATFGAKISERQCQILRRFNHVIVWPDDDSAGSSMERKALSRLHRMTRVSVVLPDEGMDLGDYDVAELVEAKISSAIPAVSKIMEW